MKRVLKYQHGYAAVMLLVFMVVGVIVAGAAVAMSIANGQAVTKFNLSQETFAAAEGGLENALLRLIRDPSYTGETLTVGSATVTISVTGSGPYTIRSKAVIGTLQRTISVECAWTNGVFAVTSWSEVYD